MKKLMKRAAKTLLALIMCFGVLHFQGLGVGEVRAAAGDEPDHEKNINS